MDPKATKDSFIGYCALGVIFALLLAPFNLICFILSLKVLPPAWHVCVNLPI
jgi:hypothetical protein